MTDTDIILTGDSTLSTWMAHPVGSQIIAGIAAQGGMDDKSLALLRNVPLDRFIAAGGNAPEGLVATLVAQANGGRLPDPSEAAGLGWRERISSGRFDGQTVIVTGAASGIGRAVASRVAREGGHVVAVDISRERLDAFVGSLPDASITGVAADITSEDGIAAILKAANGRVDGLANVAGLLDDFSPIHEVSDAVLERVFNVNVFGLIKLTRAVVPLMIDARRGSIVNISSEAAIRGSSAGLAYTASKHAVVGVTRNTAFMCEPYGIRVNSVAPGGTLTGMRPGATNDEGQRRLDSHHADVPIALPEALAASVTFLLSDDSVNVNGVLLPSDGGESVF
ncbi:NAD(P)-dependent dehydrogenase (short-subunit alcohol dehydrogenase family) [Frondihabitans sp. PhB188]|uniref:SDR family NAD(P)-dependent oxidoreductase n=1 Tax=Frondihabitans sp. PhB188 TaxID=2485200 RepID=UPI000F47F74F|nr:SDR family oxidoreductase [Frondihabitans sp. PhB188]ROQ31047.1 NAD(P)-dependent dehydrogenase (short-subunit alcohol dehydrogenase family) [Frondihabitans sp. PhB188]